MQADGHQVDEEQVEHHGGEPGHVDPRRLLVPPAGGRSGVQVGRIDHPRIGTIEVFGWNLVHRTTLYMQQQNRIEHVFDVVDKFVKSHYNINSALLDQLLMFQRNYVIDYRNMTNLPNTQHFDFDFLGFLIDDAALDAPITYQFDSTEDKTQSLDRFLENMYFGRKRNFGKTTITTLKA